MPWWLRAAAFAAVLPAVAGAQEAMEAPPPRPGPEAAVAPEDADALPTAEGLLSADELDELVAPIALYPDSLLTQVLVAATYPLDVMKADRFLDENADMPDTERPDRAQAEDWDESVKVLAGGFPDVLGRMAEDIDWTEELGDAMLAQTDDLLDAVQRMRARAEAVGNLESNEAQTVQVEGDTISIAPADPQVVYVPAYDPATAYSVPPTAPTVVYDDPGISYGSVLTTGAIAFGSALLVDEIFDDDDDWDDDWDDYWHGPGSIDWDEDEIYARRGDIEGDVTINVDGEEVKIGEGDLAERGEEHWEASRERRDEARRNIEKRQDQRIADRGQRQDEREVGLDERQGDRDVRREDRPDRGEAGELTARDGAGGTREDRRTQAEAKLKARSDQPGGLHQAADRRPATADRPRPKAESALKPSGSGRPQADKARERGATSLKRDASSAAAKARAPSVSKPKAISKPKTARPQVKAPPRKPAAHSTAFNKPQVSASRSRASASRGKSSRGRSGGGGRRR